MYVCSQQRHFQTIFYHSTLQQTCVSFSPTLQSTYRPFRNVHKICVCPETFAHFKTKLILQVSFKFYTAFKPSLPVYKQAFNSLLLEAQNVTRACYSEVLKSKSPIHTVSSKYTRIYAYLHSLLTQQGIIT